MNSPKPSQKVATGQKGKDIKANYNNWKPADVVVYDKCETPNPSNINIRRGGVWDWLQNFLNGNLKVSMGLFLKQTDK